MMQSCADKESSPVSLGVYKWQNNFPEMIRPEKSNLTIGMALPFMYTWLSKNLPFVLECVLAFFELTWIV